jgi:competence protein ComEC
LLTDVVISHADKDHSGGLGALLASNVQVDRIWIQDDHDNSTIHFGQVIAAFEHARAEGARRLIRGFPHSDAEPIEHGDTVVEFLGPRHELRMTRGDRNRLSVVVRIVQGGKGVALLPGDLDHQGFRALDLRNRSVASDWLVAPHHGGLSGTGRQSVTLLQELLAKTGAKHVFFSFGRSDGYRLPRAELIASLLEGQAPPSIKCSQLSIRCAPELPGEDHPWRMVSAGGYSTPSQSCAGSVVLNLDDLSWAAEEDHREFIAVVSQAMCRSHGVA